MATSCAITCTQRVRTGWGRAGYRRHLARVRQRRNGKRAPGRVCRADIFSCSVTLGVPLCKTHQCRRGRQRYNVVVSQRTYRTVVSTLRLLSWSNYQVIHDREYTPTRPPRILKRPNHLSLFPCPVGIFVILQVQGGGLLLKIALLFTSLPPRPSPYF